MHCKTLNTNDPHTNRESSRSDLINEQEPLSCRAIPRFTERFMALTIAISLFANILLMRILAEIIGHLRPILILPFKKYRTQINVNIHTDRACARTH